MYQVFVQNSDGDRIEILATRDEKFFEGAKRGSEALLDLFIDDMDLDEGYQIVTKKDEGENRPMMAPDFD